MFPINSEIRRYYWQDFSLQRTIAMPAVLMAIVYLMLEWNENFGSVSRFAIYAFFVLVFIWGGNKAACSITDEVKDNTWDNQRLSAISPLNLSLGKLFGSTLYPWYGGAVALLIYILSVVGNQSVEFISYNVVLFLASGVFCHAIAVLASLHSLRAERRHGRLQSLAYFIVALLISSMFYKAGTENFLSGRYYQPEFFGTVKWFYFEFDKKYFSLGLLFIFLLWSIVGIYRLMREELQFKNIPWVWGLFVIFMMVYMAGFFYKEGYKASFDLNDSYLLIQARRSICAAFAVGIISTYLMLFSDIISVTNYRIMLYRWKQKKWIKFGESIPKWIVSLVLTLIVAVMTVVSFFPVQYPQGAYGSFILVVSIVLFILRDATILHYFKFSSNNKRASLATIFYLAMLYILLPSFFLAAKLRDFVYAFYPIMREDASAVSLLPILVQVVIVGLLVHSRWEKANKTI